MAVFLTVLKVIGIVLLSVIALVLLLAMILLFVPFRYRLEAVADTEEKRYDAAFHMTYIFRLLHGRVLYNNEGELVYDLRFLGFKIWPKEEEEEAEEEELWELPEPEKEEEKEEEKEAEVREKLKEPAAGSPGELPAEEETEAEPEPEPGPEPSKLKLYEKLKEYFSFIGRCAARVKKGLKNFGYTIKRLYDKIKKFFHRIGYFRKLWELKSSERARKLIWKETKRLCRNIRPRKSYLEGRFGLDNPGDTGELLGILRGMGILDSKKVHITPDFEHELFCGRFLIKGYLQLYVLGIVTWKLYFDKDVRKFYRRIKAGLGR